MISLEHVLPHIEAGARPVYRGEVSQVSGLIIEAEGVPAAMGEICRIQRGALGSIDAEVVGFRGATTLLMPHGELEGIAPKQGVCALGRSFSVGVGNALLGRVLDGFGAPLSAAETLPSLELRSVRQSAPAPLDRVPIRDVMPTGVRAIDSAITLGRGQRLGIFSGSGVGKSSLLGHIARGAEADVVVCALVGERGREVRSFLDDVLGPQGRSRSVTVVATSDRPPIERYMAPFVAVTIAEAFRDQGLNVLLLMDSVTRFAIAAREIGLAAGEPPTVRGYPPSFFATVPKLVERMGTGKTGSITGLLTVLLDGDDPNEPVADTLRGLLDGHLYLSRDLANRGHFPAIDLVKSLSRLMPEITVPEHMALAREMREMLADYQEGRDLVEIGAYRKGTNPKLDRALARLPEINAFLQQDSHDHASLPETLGALAIALGYAEAA